MRDDYATREITIQGYAYIEKNIINVKNHPHPSGRVYNENNIIQ